MLRQIHACSKEGFIKRLIKGLCNTQALTGGFHFRSQTDLCSPDFLKGEYRHLNGKIICFRLQSRLIAKLLDRLSDDHLCRQIHNRNSCHLADIRHGTGGTGIYLDHIYILTDGNELNVDQPLDMKGLCQPFGVIRNLCLHRIGNRRCRINGNTVTGMDAGSFNMLHNTRNQDIRAVTHRIHFDFLPLQVFVNQNRMILCDPIDDIHKLFDLFIGNGDLHALAAQHVGGSYQNRITQSVCNLLSFLCRKYSAACCSRDLCFFQYLIKQLSVFSRIHILCPGS